MINARLTSDKASMSARLVDYFENYETALRQFANAPVGVVAAACTGASYLAGREREAGVTKQIEARHGFPFVTAALAVVDALNTLEARRLGLVSPYPDDLNRASIGYWQSHGFEVADVANAFNTDSSFHPIYSLGGSAASQALRTLEGKPLDAIVMLGTGMPTLHPIADAIGWKGAPVMSCNLCLAWRAVEALEKSQPRRETLQDWLCGKGWVAQLKARQ
jgi:maleate cis-trans isomerase